MDAYDVARWNRCNELAKSMKIKIELYNSGFKIIAGKQCCGVLGTVEELYAFLCGYDWSKTK